MITSRITAAITLLSLLLPSSVLGAFSDVTAGSRYSTAINALQEKGVLEGYADGRFRADNRINRAELLKIVVEAIFEDEEIDDLLSRVRLSGFPDIDSGAWYARYVYFANAKGIVAGYPDGRFRPEQDVNFVEASKIFTLAYGQQVQGGGEWYVPYVRALESSKAIPPSIGALDAALTRGEMAEMMWRISEGITDQESQGYLNVKYPEASVNFSADSVQVAKSCADLAAVVEEGKASASFGYGRDVMMMEERAADGVSAGAPAPQANSALPKSGGGGDDDFSQTNVQVEGVDEADVVKTDGEYLYMIRGQTVRIVQAKPASGMKEVASIDLASDFTPSELFVDDGKLIVVSSGWKHIALPGPVPMPLMEKVSSMIYPPYPVGRSITDVRIYDVSNASSPSLSRTLSFEGNSVGTRRIEDKLYLVLQQPTQWYYPMLRTEAELLPVFDDSAKNLEDEPVARCGTVSILPHVQQPEFMTVAVIPTDDTDADVKREVVLGSAQTIYMSLQNLYVATTEWNYLWDAERPQSTESTNLYRFELTDDGVTMEAKGKVPGHIDNQFSMDEHDNIFRVTTTIPGGWWENAAPSTNNLYTLNMSMETVGKIEEIAPGETIYSTRFIGDRAYMVTFRTIDPFFVIDVSDARNPRILGKLKIPGFSDYLHPYDENHVLGFGKEAVESKDGTFAWQQGIKVALFDVTDVENPKELHKLAIGDRGTESPLLWNHKALLFEKDRNLLAFPVTVAKVTDEQRESYGLSAYGSPVFQGAQVYTLNLKDGFKLRGEITHYDDDAFMKAGDMYYAYGRDIERIVRIDDLLYTLSQYGVAAHTEQTVKEQGMMKFEE